MLFIDIRRFIAESDDILNLFKIYFHASRHITEEWKLPVTEMEDPIETFQEAKAAINTNNIKMLRNEKQCVVFGSVNAGKSTTINAMINVKDVKKLPVGNGSVTNCFIEVRKSDNNENYVIFPDDPRNEHDLEELKRCDASNGHKFKTGSVVKLFYSGECSDLLKDNFIIVDTPGNNLDKSMDTHIQEICKESDILIFVVNSSTDFGYKEKEFLSRHQTQFSKFKLILLFNLWDKMDESRRAEYLNKAKEYIRYQLNNSETEDNKDIFFISSKERLKITSNNQDRKEGWEIRNNSFNQFLTFLKKHMNEKGDVRIESIKKDNIKIINEIFCGLERYKCKTHKRIVKKFKNDSKDSKDLNHLNEIINNEIQLVWESNYELFFKIGLNISRLYENEDKNVVEKFKIFQNEQMIVIIESLKLIIKDIISNYKVKNEEYIMNILEKIYFKKYFITTQDTNSETIHNAFLEIKRKIVIFRSLTVSGITLPAAGLAVGVGIVGGIFVELATAIAAPIFATAAGITVGGGVGAASYAMTKIETFERFAYKARYVEFEDKVQRWYNCLMEPFLHSYSTFEKNLSNDVSTATPQLDNQFDEIIRSLNIFNERWN